MAKFYGTIGYAQTVEVSPGVWKERIIERSYTGDLIRNTRKLQGGDKVNTDITVSNEVSIIADPFANGNFHAMRYISFMGARWKIESAEVQYPRLILSIGGLYNGGNDEDRTSSYA